MSAYAAGYAQGRADLDDADRSYGVEFEGRVEDGDVYYEGYDDAYCPKRAHKANMVNLYDGEYQCQECRWGL